MIEGLFSPTHIGADDPAPTEVPLVEAFLYVPAVDAHVSLQFLVDTGADVTVLHPQDCQRLIPLSDRAKWQLVRRREPEHLGGAGRGVAYYPLPAVIGLSHREGAVDLRPLVLWIADPESGIEHESLLGRDVLSFYTLIFKQDVSLTLEPR